MRLCLSYGVSPPASEAHSKGDPLMGMKSEIRRLARMEESPYPFCSLYLNTKWDDEQQRERIRLFLKNQLKKVNDQMRDREDWQKAFSTDQERIERYVEGLIRQVDDETTNGVALFCCGGTGTFLTYPSLVPFNNEFSISNLPRLQPLVRLSSQYQNTLAVMVETDSARFFGLSLEGMKAESSIESYVPGRHDQGGWAQMRYQRHIEDHRDKHHKDVAERLTELFDSGQWRRVVLMGQERTVANFKAFLPERIKQSITDVFSIDFSEERSKILRRLFERLLQKEREKVTQEVQQLVERTPQGGLATLGLLGVLEAAERKQIHTLYLLTSFSERGGKCFRCQTLTPLSTPQEPSPRCPICKEETQGVDLAEEIIRGVLRQDGEVKWVDTSPALKEHEGIGASLRFR